MSLLRAIFASFVVAHGFERQHLLKRPNADICNASFKPQNGTTVQGGKLLYSVMLPLPEDFSDQTCCEVAGGDPNTTITSVKYRPSKKYKGQYDYICSVFQGGELVPGNASTHAAVEPAKPPPPPPDCAAQKDLDSCLTYGGDVGMEKCAWWNETCHIEPPIECGNGVHGPLCINIILADHAFPHGPSGRQLGSFNWSLGSVTQDEPIVKMPTQILKLGQSDWWSVGSGVLPNGTGVPFQVCVQYNELLPDGKSDPNSAFEGCLSGPKTLDITRGTTHNLAAYANYGTNSVSKALWAQLVFWSNETSVAEGSLIV